MGGRDTRRLVLELGGAVLLTVSVFCLLFAGFVLSYACGQGCPAGPGEGVPPGVPWHDTADAWQWRGQAAMALAAVVCAAFGRFAVRQELPRLATGLMACAVLLLVAWLAVIVPVV